MRKILSIMLTLTVLVMLFSSCGLTSSKSPTISEFYSEHTKDTSWVYQNVTPVPDLPTKELMSTIGDYSSELKAFAEEGATSTDVFVYSLLQNKTVHTFTVSNDDVCKVEIIKINGNPFFTIIHGVKRTDGMDFSTTLYDTSGKQIATADGIHRTPPRNNTSDYDFEITVKADLICFDQTIFKISENGSATLLKEKSDFTPDLPDFKFYNENFYISSAKNGFDVYNASLELITQWTYKEASDDRIDYDYFFLNDGTILFQTIETVSDNAINYNVRIDGNKCKVSTLIIDPKTGKEKKVNASFVLDYVYALDQNLSLVLDEDYDTDETVRESMGISKKYQNIASISYIKNKELTNPVTVAMSNTGKITCELFSDLPLSGGGIPMFFADGVYYYYTVNGTYMFVNEKGETLKELDESTFKELEYNANYIVFDGVIYDHSFQPIYDFGADGYELYSNGLGSSAMMSDGMILTRDGSDYLYRNGSVKFLAANDINDNLFDELFDVTEHYYVIKTTEHRFNFTFTYFNAHGEELFTSPHSGIRRMWSKDLSAVLYTVSDPDGNDILYYISK